MHADIHTNSAVTTSSNALPHTLQVIAVLVVVVVVVVVVVIIIVL
jgi:hypothetical protein